MTLGMHLVGFRWNVAAKDQLVPRGVGWFHALWVPDSRQHGSGREEGWRRSRWQHRRHSRQHSRYPCFQLYWIPDIIWKKSSILISQNNLTCPTVLTVLTPKMNSYYKTQSWKVTVWQQMAVWFSIGVYIFLEKSILIPSTRTDKYRILGKIKEQFQNKYFIHMNIWFCCTF